MRSVTEWIGLTDDTAVPARVKERVLTRYHERCHWSDREIRPTGPQEARLAMADTERDEVASHDLRGEVCPMTFVKAKIQLDRIRPGEALELILKPGEQLIQDRLESHVGRSPHGAYRVKFGIGPARCSPSQSRRK